MAVKIYTYADPYSIDKENYWDEIKDCPQFCVSQTLVNGMMSVYPHFKKRQNVTTIRDLVNSLYPEWDDISKRVQQIMEVDSAINSLVINNPNAENIKRSLLFNTKNIVSSIRTFKELGIDASLMLKKNINIDQEYLIDIYTSISSLDNSAFYYSRVNEKHQIDAAIIKAIHKRHDLFNPDQSNMNTIVVHGIHQFSPAMLCAIEDIGRYKDLILLFNYQSQYKSVYETWLNIYSLFDSPIQMSTISQFRPIPLMVNSYRSNLIADGIGKISNGNYNEPNDNLKDCEIIEFDNITEFANYVAIKFDRAKKNAEALGDIRSVLAYMDEQLYSASTKVNDILRAYFPEQFGERHFLDYPIGHFFIATANMWDSEKETIVVQDFSDIKECLSSGIFTESKAGLLLSTFNKIENYIEKDVLLNVIISKLKNLKKHLNAPLVPG